MKEGVPTAFIQWYQGAWCKGVKIALLHSMLNYLPRMGMPPSPWDNLSFVSKGKMNCVTVGCANCFTASLHQIGSAIYVLTVEAIDTDMAADPSAELLERFLFENSGIDSVCFHKTIYLPYPYLGMFL